MPRSSRSMQVLEDEHLVEDLLRQIRVVFAHVVEDRCLGRRADEVEDFGGRGAPRPWPSS